MFELTEMNLDIPLTEVTCSNCQSSAAPTWQVRLSAAECGQPQDIIAFNCSVCGFEDYIRDDVSILDAEILESENYENK